MRCAPFNGGLASDLIRRCGWPRMSGVHPMLALGPLGVGRHPQSLR